MKKCDADFKNIFLNVELKEAYFYAHTKIRATGEYVEKYIRFKNKVGRNCNWDIIRIINSFLDTSGEEITIKIHKYQIIWGKLLIIIGVALYFSAFIFYYYYANFYELTKLKDFILIAFVFLILMSFGFVCIYQSIPFSLANKIKKRLELFDRNQSQNN